jgi:hypothetical protein
MSEGDAMAEQEVWTDRLRVAGDALATKVRELIREGNVRRIVVKNAEDQTVMELPITFGILGAVAAPILAAVGAIAGLAANWKLEVERTEPPKAEDPTTPGTPASGT